MNIAIVDVGSNNIKLELFEVHSNGSPYLLLSQKFPARLGHDVFLTQKLNHENMELAMEAFHHIAKISKSHDDKTIIALGTAALRETNHEDFLKKVHKETGIQIQVIPGVEEARLVYLGVLAHTRFDGRTFFLNDIGGGSTEISVSDDKQMYFAESLRLGTVRLKEMFDPDTQPDAIAMMERYVKKMFAPHLEEIRSYHLDMGLSTGGTARNLMEIVRHRIGKLPEENGIAILPTDVLVSFVEDLKKMNPVEIAHLKGLDPLRADIILAGGILLATLLKEIGIKQSLISFHGLRDGAISDYIYRKIDKKFYLQRQENYKLHFLEQAAKKHNTDSEHAFQTAKLSLQIFDNLLSLHGLGINERDILYGAALLHDAGKIIDYSHHHKHSKYIIENIKLMGFSRHEIKLMALIARYHRKSMPKNSHPEFMELTDGDKLILKKLASILRIADALDRSNTRSVRSIDSISVEPARIVLHVSGKGDISLELWSLESKKDLFLKVFARDVRLHQAEPS